MDHISVDMIAICCVVGEIDVHVIIGTKHVCLKLARLTLFEFRVHPGHLMFYSKWRALFSG